MMKGRQITFKKIFIIWHDLSQESRGKVRDGSEKVNRQGSKKCHASLYCVQMSVHNEIDTILL